MMSIVVQTANAAFPTTQENEEKGLLKLRFGAFILSCRHELGIDRTDPNHILTVDEAMKCSNAFNSFKELTGGSDRDVIDLIVTELRGNGGCGGIALSDKAMGDTMEIMGKQFSC